MFFSFFDLSYPKAATCYKIPWIAAKMKKIHDKIIQNTEQFLLKFVSSNAEITTKNAEICF